MDRLIEAIEAKQNPSVVGLDPTEALVPAQIVAGFAEEIQRTGLKIRRKRRPCSFPWPSSNSTAPSSDASQTSCLRSTTDRHV